MKRLFEPHRERGTAKNGNIVVVPAIGLPRPSEWLDESGEPWLKRLLTDVVPSVKMWEYLPTPDKGTSVAHRLLLEGSKLLAALYEHCVKDETSKQPLIFICHGTGGFVLKKALCICREQFLQYRALIDVISGVILLGSPHFRGNIEETRQILDLMSKCQRKGTVSSSTQIDAKDLIEVCKSFELLSLGVPFLSVCESKVTQTQYSIFSKRRNKGSKVIVTKDLATLGAITEEVLEVEANHIDIIRVPVGGEIFRACAKILSDILKEAPLRIAEASKPYHPPSVLGAYTLRSSGSIGPGLEERFLNQMSLTVSDPPGGATGGSTTGSFEMVPAEIALEPTRRDPRLPCFSLGTRQKMDLFIGRKNLLEVIDRHLLPPAYNPDTGEKAKQASIPSENLRSFAICGLGGIGKTSLAVEYACSRKEAFDAIFWLGADDAKILAANFAQIAIQLGLEDDVSDFAASRDVVMGWLAQPLRKMSSPESFENLASWLLIFDNVDDLHVLSDYWPKFGKGSVLITSRDPYAKNHLFTENGIDLPPLSASESELLMQGLTHVKADANQERALSDITVQLGGLPLAITQMSGVFRRLRLSYTEFDKFCREEGIVKLFESEAVINGSTNPRSLATIWALDRLPPSTKALLQVICLLDPDSIPEKLLIDRLGQVKLDNYPQKMHEYYDARKELLSSSLINHNTDEEKLSIHRLIQETAKAMMDKETLIETYNTAMSLVISAWPFQSMKNHHSVTRFDECEVIFPNVLRLKQGIEHLVQLYPDFKPRIQVARLFNDTGWYMFERGLPEETKPFCDLALLLAARLEDSLGSIATESIRESHSFIGIALVETNEHVESMSHKMTWLNMLLERKTVLGDIVEDYELGYAYNEVGVAYGNADRIDEAIEAFHRSIYIFQSLDDYEDTMLGWPEPNLGFMFWIQGKLDEAESALVEILDIHVEKWGVDDTESFKTGKILYGIGNVLEAQGRFEESFEFHRRCFEQYKKVLGMNHHRFGDICYKMAGHCMRMGAMKDAQQYLDSAMRIFGSRPYLANELARSAFKKGMMFSVMGMTLDAEKLFLESYKIRKKLRPRDYRPFKALSTRDFDSLVAFWSR